jgi:Ca-activated chloride channel family protein
MDILRRRSLPGQLRSLRSGSGSNRTRLTRRGDAPPPVGILRALSRLTLYRLQERAREEAQAGHYENATRHLKNLAQHLLSQGEKDLAKTTLLEANNLEHMQALSRNGGKEIKYGTRALLCQPSEERK